MRRQQFRYISTAGTFAVGDLNHDSPLMLGGPGVVLHFVDPATGVHTQNVESYWNRVKGKFKRMKGVHELMLNSYLDEFMWRERHGRRAVTALASLCRDISLKYPQ